MIDDQIRSGDYVVVERRSTARNGEIVVAVLPSEFGGHGAATLKRFYREGKRVRLQPANAKLDPIYVEPPSRLEVQGVVVGSCGAIASSAIASSAIAGRSGAKPLDYLLSVAPLLVVPPTIVLLGIVTIAAAMPCESCVRTSATRTTLRPVMVSLGRDAVPLAFGPLVFGPSVVGPSVISAPAGESGASLGNLDPPRELSPASRRSFGRGRDRWRRGSPSPRERHPRRVERHDHASTHRGPRRAPRDPTAEPEATDFGAVRSTARSGACRTSAGSPSKL